MAIVVGLLRNVLAYPQYAAYGWKIKLGGIVGLGLPALAWIACLAPLVKGSSSRTLHGDARFATRRDLQKAGLLKASPNGIVVGKFGRKLIRLQWPAVRHPGGAYALR